MTTYGGVVGELDATGPELDGDGAAALDVTGLLFDLEVPDRDAAVPDRLLDDAAIVIGGVVGAAATLDGDMTGGDAGDVTCQPGDVGVNAAGVTGVGAPVTGVGAPDAGGPALVSCWASVTGMMGAVA